MKLRIGRSVGRTLYLQRGDQPSKDDTLVGMMDTRELAEAVVAAVNHAGAGFLALTINTPVKTSDCDCGVRLGQNHRWNCAFMRKLEANAGIVRCEHGVDRSRVTCPPCGVQA